MSDALQIIFLGTAAIACPSLRVLHEAPCIRELLVVTQPDRPSGRRLALTAPPVKVLAREIHLPVWQPDKIRHPDWVEQIRQWGPDLIVVAAYGQILPQRILEIPRFGCLNIHASLLPKYRGAAPIQWALLNGDTETGVTIMEVEERMDAGGIVANRAIPIGDQDDASRLHDRLAELGAQLLAETIPGYVKGQLFARPQNEGLVMYTRKIKKEDGFVNWAESASQLDRRLRALKPWPGLFTYLNTGRKPRLLKFWQARPDAESGSEPGVILRANDQGVWVACGQGSLRFTELQLEGSRPLPVSAFLAGHPLAPGTKLG